MRPLEWYAALSVAYQGRSIAIKRGQGRREGAPGINIFTPCGKNRVRGIQQMLRENLLCSPEKQSENTWLGPLDFTPAADRTIYSKSTRRDGRRGSTAAHFQPRI